MPGVFEQNRNWILQAAMVELADGRKGKSMKRFLIPAVAALLLAIGFASAPSTAQAGTITLIDADFLQPGGQGAGDHTHATNNAPHGFSGFHKFGSYNDTF